VQTPASAREYALGGGCDLAKGLEMGFAEACVFEASLFGLVASTGDMREGTRAFREKRTPEFRGH
jgi:enoyl-CoA hydratase